MNGNGPRILLIGGTYRALCVLERLLERGERVAAYIGQEGGGERDFCSEILEICDRASIPARSGRKLGEEIVRWLEDRIRPDVAIAVGVTTEIPLSVGGNCRLGIVEVIDRLQLESCPGVTLRQRGQDMITREVPVSEDLEDREDDYLAVVDATVDALDEYLDRLASPNARGSVAIRLESSPVSAEEIEACIERTEPGATTERLERDVRDYVEADACLALGDTAAGFQLLAAAFGLGDGDEVICPGLASSGALRGLRAAGVETVFADVEDDRLSLDPLAAEEAITPRTRALLVGHAFGQPAALDQLYGLAEEHGLEVIEDGGAALGARFGPSRLGRSPCACVFRLDTGSTAPGTGAAVLTLPPALAERFSNAALDSRLGDGAAGLALRRFSVWEERLSTRRENASFYSQELHRYDAFRVPPTPEEALPTYPYYLLRTTRFARTSSDDLHKLLTDIGIESRRVGVHLSERELAVLPATEALRSNGLLLPIDRPLSSAEREQILDAIFDFAIG